MNLVINCSQCGRSIRQTVSRGRYSLLEILTNRGWKAITGGYLCNECGMAAAVAPSRKSKTTTRRT